MASSFPGAIDNFTDPLANSSLASPSHAGQHSDLNDAVEKIETYMGLVKVIPTAATNGTINATTGTVTVGNAVSSITIRCFSSLYDHYRITYSQITGTAGANLGLRLSLNGTAATTGYYGALTYMSVTTSSAYAGVNENNAGSFSYIGSTNQNARFTGSFDLLNPFLTEGTVIACSPFIKISPAFDIGIYNGGLNNSTSYNEFVLLPNTGTFTGGSIRVYGYRN